MRKRTTGIPTPRPAPKPTVEPVFAAFVGLGLATVVADTGLFEARPVLLIILELLVLVRVEVAVVDVTLGDIRTEILK